MLGNSRTAVFSMICGFGALRSRVAKAAGQHRNEKLRVACREARVQLKIQNAKKINGLRSLFEVQMSKKGTPLWR